MSTTSTEPEVAALGASASPAEIAGQDLAADIPDGAKTLWRQEWKTLAAILVVFIGFFWLPVGWVRFDNGVMESLYLSQYAQEHVLLCLVPAFFIAGAIVQGLMNSGMGKGPALSLLLAGPALSLPSMIVLSSIVGFRKMVVYVSLVVVMYTITGVFFGAFWG